MTTPGPQPRREELLAAARERRQQSELALSERQEARRRELRVLCQQELRRLLGLTVPLEDITAELFDGRDGAATARVGDLTFRLTFRYRDGLRVLLAQCPTCGNDVWSPPLANGEGLAGVGDWLLRAAEGARPGHRCPSPDDDAAAPAPPPAPPTPAERLAQALADFVDERLRVTEGLGQGR